MTAVNPRLLLPILVVVTGVGPMAMHIILPSLPGLQTVFDFIIIALVLFMRASAEPGPRGEGGLCPPFTPGNRSVPQTVKSER